MLMFMCLNRADHLLQDNSAASTRLGHVIYHLCKNQLHPKGTVIVSTPAPFYAHASKVAGYLQQPGVGLVVEDSGIIVEYGSRGGGLTAQHKKKYIPGGVDTYIVAHANTKTTNGTLEFTCNEEVTCQNFRDRVRAMETVRTSSSTTPRCPTP
ncbi:unnamed protein product [Pylaiella littoralis]